LTSTEKAKKPRSNIYIGIAVIAILIVAFGAGVYLYTPQHPLKLFTSGLEVINIGLEVFVEDLGNHTPRCEFVDSCSSCQNLRLVAMRLQNADYLLYGGVNDVVAGTENSQVNDLSE
jgi:hypothetical protein